MSKEHPGLTPAVVAYLLEQTREKRGDGEFPEADLARLASGFIEAGDAWLADAFETKRWIQINVTLDPRQRHPGMTLVSGRLQDRVQEWLAGGVLEAFHFLFKPPGVRLRFLGAPAHLEVLLPELCDDLARDSALIAYATALYDSETYQFGGEAGLAAAHRFFTADSVAVLRFWRQVFRGEATLGAAEFSLTLLDLFLRRVAGDEWELWDIWCRMDLAGRRVDASGEERTRELAAAGASLVERLRRGDADLAWLPEGERANLLVFREQVSPLCDHWRELHATGRLLYPLREILPFLIVFHFNRMCFGSDEQRALSSIMQTLLSPKLTQPNRAALR
jgi:thiopeptide-type bacteriocin biosynthesis protein